jgi:acetoin utilization deacetylase AcuC-like enzyme
MIGGMIATFTDLRCLGHTAPPGYPERPERLRGVLGHLEAQGHPVTVSAGGEEARERARQAVLAVHDPAYVERFERAARRGDGLLDSADNPLSEGTWEGAWAAVETALAAAEAAVAGTPAFAAVRPPGHHAERALAMGFCFFNGAAVAAQHLIDRHGLERVAIFDLDVHHGNGTQHLFEARADVLYASTHQYPFYPGTGAASERGVGPGEGATLNVPLPAGTGDAVYGEAIAGTIVPALEAFAPQALILSAGFDAWQRDPLGGMKVSEAGFHHWGELLGELADRICGGRVLALLEGGYDLEALPRLVEAHLLGLAGRAPAAED